MRLFGSPIVKISLFAIDLKSVSMMSLINDYDYIFGGWPTFLSKFLSNLLL